MPWAVVDLPWDIEAFPLDNGAFPCLCEGYLAFWKVGEGCVVLRKKEEGDVCLKKDVALGLEGRALE